MATTVAKGYELQATGANVGTWGAVNNTSVIQIIDNNLGAITTKALTNVNVTLSATEAQSAILRLTGTLTGNVQITSACIGFYFVENLTTGSFAVTVTNGVSGVVIPQSSRCTVIADATNGVRLADQSLIPSGTVMIFRQTSAPAGWTKQTAINDYALRVTNGAVSTGGSTGFTSVFTSRSIAQANLPAYYLSGTTEVENSAHTHLYTLNSSSTTAASGSGVTGLMQSPTSNFTGAETSTHTHNIAILSGGSNVPLDFAVAYADVIIATKN